MEQIALPLAAPRIDLEALHGALRRGITGEVRVDRLGRALYSTDASIYQIVPLAIVLPRTRGDIEHTLGVCRDFGVPITARGGGTSQAGQSIGAGIILDCSKFYNQVVEVNAAERWVRVQPGCVLADLNEHVKAHNLHFAPDISTANRATIGGMVANNSSGTRSVIYGKTIDHVLELTVLLADGSVMHCETLEGQALQAKCAQQSREGDGYRALLRLAQEHAREIDVRYPKILRRVGGYNLDLFRDPNRANLSQLLVGSEGTLGIVLEAKLRLVELPRLKAVLVAQFADLLSALDATPLVLQHSPSAVEVMDRYILDSTRLNPEAARLRDFLHGDPGAILIIEFYFEKKEDIVPRLEAVERALVGRGTHFLHAVDAQLQQRIWKLRTLALGLSMAEKGDAKSISFVEDTAVRPEVLRDYIDEFLRIIARHDTRAGVYAHASVGCLHVRPVIDLKTDEGLRQFQGIAEEVADLVLKYHGALSGEHGDGMVRSPFQEKMFGTTLYQAFREIKRTFDPNNLLNPGKIVDSPPLTANLRYGPAYVTPDVDTVFDFTADGGITRAAELCAGVGECRKTRGGAMCPSYRATREEQHSTRGRANALRLAITGQCDLHGLSDPALHDALDLCLECKACKSECPTNVDMARLKAEHLHQHYSRHGLPWRSWLFGRVADITRSGGRLGNWWIRSGAGRWLNDRLLGIDGRRLPPRLARQTLLAQYPPATGFGTQVLLFPDTFTSYFEPEIGLAAQRVLASMGCDLVARPFVCCGRPMISNGMLPRAVAHAERNVHALFEWASAGKRIMACEPSCILTIKDDYPALLRGEARRRAEVVAEQCRTFEEVVAELSPRATARTADGQARNLLLHTHCHQRSLVGVGPTMRALDLLPGARVIDLDAGCCGMAGSFGYEKEHYEVSRAVGEQALFPALRKAGDSVIVAPGFSCRLQIEHFLGKKALHPALVLDEAAVSRSPSAT